MYTYFVFPIRFFNIYQQKIQYLPIDCPPYPEFSNYSASKVPNKRQGENRKCYRSTNHGFLLVPYGSCFVWATAVLMSEFVSFPLILTVEYHIWAVLLVLTWTFSNYPKAWCWARVQKSFQPSWKIWNTTFVLNMYEQFRYAARTPDGELAVLFWDNYNLTEKFLSCWFLKGKGGRFSISFFSGIFLNP